MGNVLSTRSAMFLLCINLPTHRMSSINHHILSIILASAFSVTGLQFGLPHGDLVKGQSYNFTYLPADGIVSILPSRSETRSDSHRRPVRHDFSCEVARDGLGPIATLNGRLL